MKIGFVDFYISEWHANNYPAWIEATNKRLGTDFDVAYAWAEQNISPIDGRSTEDWCREMGVECCDSISELCQKSDCIIILSPSNPEKHLKYAEEVLPFAKPTYIDKTFAPDISDAEKIFDIAKKHGTPFFSTSALRFATELCEMNSMQDIVISGGGSNLNEYIIHTLEMAVVLLNGNALRVKAEAEGSKLTFFIECTDREMMTVVYSPELGFSIDARRNDGESVHKNVCSDFFGGLIENILKFFESKTLPFDSAETLQVMKMRDAILKAENNCGEWIEI